jgi:hypothetical protein
MLWKLNVLLPCSHDAAPKSPLCRSLLCGARSEALGRGMAPPDTMNMNSSALPAISLQGRLRTCSTPSRHTVQCSWSRPYRSGWNHSRRTDGLPYAVSVKSLSWTTPELDAGGTSCCLCTEALYSVCCGWVIFSGDRTFRLKVWYV